MPAFDHGPKPRTHYETRVSAWYGCKPASKRTQLERHASSSDHVFWPSLRLSHGPRRSARLPPRLARLNRHETLRLSSATPDNRRLKQLRLQDTGLRSQALDPRNALCARTNARLLLATAQTAARTKQTHYILLGHVGPGYSTRLDIPSFHSFFPSFLLSCFVALVFAFLRITPSKDTKFVPPLSASLRSRNAQEHLTRELLREPAQSKCTSRFCVTSRLYVTTTKNGPGRASTSI